MATVPRVVQRASGSQSFQRFKTREEKSLNRYRPRTSFPLSAATMCQAASRRPNVLALKGKISMKTRLACAAVALVCLLEPARLSADEIIDWNNILLNAVRTNSMSPLPQSRVSAAMNTAMYDAVNSIVRTHEPYHVNMTAVPGTSREAAAAQAAHRVLSGMVPASQASYDAALANSLSSVPDG